MKFFNYVFLLFACHGLALQSAELPPKKHTLEVRAFEMLKAPLLTISDFESAKLNRAQSKSSLSLKLSEAAAARFEHYTETHTGEKLAIVVDNKVLAEPVIRTSIKGRNFEVSGLEQNVGLDLSRLVNHQ